MRTFLGVKFSSDQRHQVAVSRDPRELLERGAKISPIFRCDGEPCIQGLPDKCLIRLVVSDAPRVLIAAIREELGTAALGSCYLSHGLASVILITEPATDKADRYDALVRKHSKEIECLMVDCGTTVETALWRSDEPTSQSPLSPGIVPDPPSGEGLPFEAASQVDRFNALMASAEGRLRFYAPECGPLLSDLRNACADLVAELRDVDASADGPQRSHHLVSILVEMTASFSIFCSQILAGALPLAFNTYPAGEYSLFGLGGAVRALLRIYEHISRVFDDANLPDRIEDSYGRAGTAFQPFVTRLQLDYAEWDDCTAAAKELAAVGPAEPGGHMTYYSARWGFRQAENTLSVSWQCIVAAASRQWNLLTLSHEYLHAHVKELLNSALEWTSDQSAEETCRSLKSGQFESARDSMRAAIFSTMAHFAACDAAPRNEKDAEVDLLTHPSVSDFRILRSEKYWLIEEIAVHSLDYLYFYNGDDFLYSSSVWNSWALVPKVSDDLEQYLLRTLCAFSTTSPISSNADETFEDCVGRLRQALEQVSEEAIDGPSASAGSGQNANTAHIVVSSALRVLGDETALGYIEERFTAGTYLARLVRKFFFEDHIHGELMADPEIASPGQRYDIMPGEYRPEPITSPTAFLLDRFANDAPTNGDDQYCEFATLWQAITLISDTQSE